MELSGKQEEIVKSKRQKAIVMSAAASGKALENGSIVYTEFGKKKIEDCKVGEYIYGEDGELHRIKGVFPQGKKRKYIITLTDGTTINCCDEHLWTFQTESQRGKKSKKWTTKTLREIIDDELIYSRKTAGPFERKSKEYLRRNIWLPMTKPVNFPKKDLPIDPYTLGALLGDGYLRGAGKSSMFTNEDKDVLEKVKEGLQNINCNLVFSGDEKRKYDYRIKQQGFLGKHKKGSFNKILESLNLDFTHADTKFIPDIYKYSSIDDRLELLKGIIDTDGYCKDGHYDITLKSKTLILDIQEICESLGLTATYQEKQSSYVDSYGNIKNCGTVYRLYIKQSEIINKIHSSERIEKQWEESKTKASRAFESIQETDEYVEMTCISIDNPTMLFLTDHFIVTHNTRTLTERVKYLIEQGIDPSKIVVITFTNLAAEEMRSRLENIPKKPFIGTIHSYALTLLIRGDDTEYQKILENQEFDLLFNEISNNLDLIPDIEYLLVDEFQDCSEIQIKFMFDMLKPKKWMVFGDIKQSMYRFNGARPDLILKLVDDPDVYTYDLDENYRNAVNILSYAKKIINVLGEGFFDFSEPMREESGAVLKLEEYNADRLANYIKLHIEREGENYKDWFVLARTNQERDIIFDTFNRGGLPVDTFKKSEMNTAELSARMAEDTIKVLTIHQSKGLENKCVAVVGAKYYSEEERCISYVAATRAKDVLVWCKPKKKIKKSRITTWE